MSRSYKKTPCVRSDDHNTWREKRQANKVVRQCSDLSNGSCFKKAYNSWNICDYKILFHGNEYIDPDVWKVRAFTNK